MQTLISSPHNLAISLFLMALTLSCPISSASGEDPGMAPFLPTWRQLNTEAKQQFIAGYLRGLQDASDTTGVVIKFVEENPSQAGEGLAKLKGILDSHGFAADQLTRAVDLFYSDPDNKDKSISAAISASRAALR